jgi:hypothetical protein
MFFKCFILSFFWQIYANLIKFPIQQDGHDLFTVA